MAKVLLINPVVREEDAPRHVPYGIALLASIAMNKGHLVQVYDENAWRLGDEVLGQVLGADDWDVIGLGGMTTAYGSIQQIVQLAHTVSPESVVVLGGGVLTSLPNEMMNWLPQVEVGVIGEAFKTFPELLDLFDSGSRNWWKVKGTISRNDQGENRLSPPQDLLENLDSLPYPAWDLFPLEEVYFPNSQALFSEEGMLTKRRLDINASYGCSLVCKFCFHLGLSGDMRYGQDEGGRENVFFDTPGNYSRTIRYHSPEYIVGMAKHMHEKYNVDYITFLDENLMTMDQYSRRTWLREICRLWKDSGLQPSHLRDGVPLSENGWDGVHWSGTSHATLCNPEILAIMRDAGCSHLVYGYESFSSQVLKKLGKGSSPKTNFQSFFWTLEAGIRPQPNQIIGFPSDDFDSIRDGLAAWDRLGIVVKPFYATPYPGSEWFSTYRKDIEAQYDGDLEAFILDLGDATKVTALISHNFNAIELLGLREAMIARDTKRINEYERIWRVNHNLPDDAPSTVYSDGVFSRKIAE